jgi:hypothetical protein
LLLLSGGWGRCSRPRLLWCMLHLSRKMPVHSEIACIIQGLTAKAEFTAAVSFALVRYF